MIGSSRESVTAEDMPSELRWILTFELFIDYGGGNIQGSHGSIHIAADDTGNIVDRPWMQTFVRPDSAKYVPTLNPLHAPGAARFQRGPSAGGETVNLPQVTPMPLARLATPFDPPDWIFEAKLDGFRATPERTEPQTKKTQHYYERCTSRTG